MNKPTITRGLDSNAEDFITRLVTSANANGRMSEEGIKTLESLVETTEGFFSTYESDFPAFGETDEFPWSGVCLPDLVEHFRTQIKLEEHADYSLTHQAQDFVTGYLEDPLNSAIHLRELKSRKAGSAWLLVNTQSHGQSGCEETVLGIVRSPKEAELLLRTRGYLFTDHTPSGQPPVSVETIGRMLLRRLGLSEP